MCMEALWGKEKSTTQCTFFTAEKEVGDASNLLGDIIGPPKKIGSCNKVHLGSGVMSALVFFPYVNLPFG